MNSNDNLNIKSTCIILNRIVREQIDLRNEVKLHRKSNMQIRETLKILKKRKAAFELIFSILVWLSLISILTTTKAYAQFNPKDVSNLVFFVESANIDTGNHVATCESNFCLTHPNSESAIITEQYCDVTDSCAEGCVRRWIDQSDYVPGGGFNPPEYTNGRNFGQDDSEKACYISNCINGKPCVRGGPAYGDDGMGNYKFKQDKYLEIEGSDAISLPGEFSIFLLAKPIDQTATGDWSYFGLAAHYVTHKVSNNSIKLRVGNTVPPSPVVTITTANAVQLNTWQLIEIHRDLSGNITSFINGVDTSVGGVNAGTGTFKVGYLLSNFKTGHTNGSISMHGDVAGFLIYDKKTSSTENNSIRNYFDSNYLGGVLNNQKVAFNKHRLKIFPNPTQDSDAVILRIEGNNLNISNLNDKFPVVYNVLGEQVKSKSKIVSVKQDSIEVQIELEKNLAKGFYLINFEGDSIKLIKS